MAVRLLWRLAAGAPVAVFPLVAPGMRDRSRRLHLDPWLRVCETPRHAAILLLVGELPPALFEAARAVHDQLPEPRAILAWGGEGAPFVDVVRVRGDEGPGAAARRLYTALLSGAVASSVPRSLRENPVRWQGVGPHGQGGEGMMGGTPYGRRVAMTDDDLRDGLSLDAVSLPLGPFLPWLPPGLGLDVTLQGDVVQSLTGRAPEGLTPDVPEAFLRARTEPVPIAVLERARAAHLLDACAALLRLHGLRAFAERTCRLADRARPEDADGVRTLARTASRAMRPALRDVGVLPSEALVGRGPLTRASGRGDDARSDDPAYRALGFSPVAQRRGDAQARLCQRFEEAAQALDLARVAGDRERSPGPTLEGPRGPLPPPTSWGPMLSAVARGMPWDAFVTTLVSLDLDPAELPGAADWGRATPGAAALAEGVG